MVLGSSPNRSDSFRASISPLARNDETSGVEEDDDDDVSLPSSSLGYMEANQVPSTASGTKSMLGIPMSAKSSSSLSSAGLRTSVDGPMVIRKRFITSDYESSDSPSSSDHSDNVGAGEDPANSPPKKVSKWCQFGLFSCCVCRPQRL